MPVARWNCSTRRCDSQNDPRPSEPPPVSLRNVGLGGAVGVAVFVAVGAAVTELASATIEFSLFIGLPAGVVAGIVAAAFVYLRLGSPDAGKQRPAIALTGFGAAFLVVLFGGVAVGLRNSVALPIAGVVGVIAAIVLYLRFDRRSAP